MSQIEILIYRPIDMDEFNRFCVEGKPDGKGGYLKDSQGRKITGVFNWLLGREVPKARFFNTAKGDDMQLWVAMVQRRETYDVPWIKRIPGFQDMIRTDGQVGLTSAFKPIEDLMALVKPNDELDKIFEQGTMRVAYILESLERHDGAIAMGKEDFLAALRGEIEGDQALFEVAKSFSVSG